MITVAGAWVALLVFYRLIDNKSGASSDVAKVDYGVTWGIFVTLLGGGGARLRGLAHPSAHRPEPPLPGEAPTAADRRRRRRSPAGASANANASGPARSAPANRADQRGAREPRADRPEIDGGTQLSFDEQE